MANIKVAVRVRPISARELHVTGSEVVVRTDGNTIFLTNLKVSASKAGDSRERTKRYDFNYCFDSSDPDAENYANQSRIYETLGQSVLDALFMGYNACFVAYGQSASGKTYTMMGSKDDPGLTPRLCEGIFARIQDEERKERNHRVTVSYLEIYNDRVRDLLKPAASGRGLKVREHPRLGPYVQGLTHHVVGTLGSLMSYVEEGTRARKTALTLQNSSSSRSHALLTVSLCSESSSAGASQLTGALSIGGSCSRRKDVPRGGGNKLHLVDLAGSESAATCSGVNRLKEGANINKSLVALGNVISALAERGSTGSGPGRRFIPYRDSSLTWLLKDALGGNATTIMLATISPASGSYNETAHTLRFAQRAQSVVNRPVVNENPVARIIRELRDEVARLKSLLLEKENIDPGSKSLCCCKEIQTVDNPDSDKDQSASPELSSDRHCMEVKNRSRSTERAKEERDAPSIRRFNSTESLSTSDSGSSGPIRKFGSFEFLSSKSPLAACNYYNRAKVTELNDEEDEIVDEINEPVFVDIPTLVAVLIKPDDSLQESSTQIEEICSDEVQEDSIDVEFIENANGQEVFENIEKLESVEQAETSSVNSTQLSADADSGDCQRNTEDAHVSASSPRGREKGKFRKQDSIDVVTHSGSSNLHTSKRFGSVEGLQKKKEPHLALERSHTNLEKRPAASDRTKKLNNIREIDDQKAHGKQVGGWKGIASSGSKDHLQRKGSNDSDKSLKESSNGGQSGSKNKNGAVRKPSLENLKRKTSKDSSSSSSKEEQIVISNLTRDKLLRRKGSLDQEPPVARTHTPIQRVKRAEIVAAVTERLYASRKHVEESATASTPGSGTRSPPEAADVKLGSPFYTRTKLQEISRKMLAKRRRVCVDTQTDIDRTVRVKDTASLTEEPQVILQDAAVLTDHHENCEVSTEGVRVPVLRVKEIATLTDKPRTPIVRCKDAESMATDLDDYDYEIHSPRNDSGILSDDTQNYAESNLSSTEVSDACIETDRRVVCTDSSTNTMYLSPGRSPVPIPQAPRQEPVRQQPKGPRCDRQCCNMLPEVPQIVTPASPEKNVISISLPDMISITIESTNGIESRIAMTDCSDSVETAIRPKLRNIEAQTDEASVRKDEEDESADNHFCFKDLSRSATGLTDGKIFRIENIFQDPKIASKACTKVDTVSDAGEDSGPRKSVTFTNSLGTSFVPDTRERATEMEREKIHAEDKAIDFQKRTSFAQAFVSKRCGYERSLPEAPQSAFYSNSPTICTCPAAAIDSAEFKKEFEIVSPGWQRACSEVSRNGLIFSCHNGVVCMAANNCVPLLMKRRQIENPYETRSSSTTPPTCDRCTNLTEPCIEKPPTISRPDASNDYESNFSDDSLDYDEEVVPSAGQPSKSEEVKNRENHDNLCPPDVVAHTKKDASTSSGYMDAENTESSANSDFEDSHVELPRKKTADLSSGTKLHDYKSLILGDSLIMFSESSVEEEDGCKTPSSQSSGNSKKRVSFSNVTEERSQRKLDRQALSNAKQSSHVELKSIIKKKKKKSNMPETFERSQSSTDSTSTDDSVHSKMSLTDDSQDSCAAFDAASAKLEKRLESIGNSQDSDEFCPSQDDRSKSVQFSGQEFDDNYSETDSECNAISDEEYSASLRRDIVREYLDQATTFMRNMNSINEYMNATKMLDRNLGRGKRRGHRRRGYRLQNQDYVEYQGRRISLKDDPAEYIDDDDDDIVVPIESYERCLASINRLESCIERVNEHNDLLREKYNIDVESAGARQDLARTSSDLTAHRSRNDNVKANPTIDVPPENVSRSSRAPRDSWFVDQADYEEDLDAAERHIVKQISDLDLDGKNNDARHGLEDDLEKRIFDQLMSVVESSRCTKRLRDRYPSETLDLRSSSPPTYSRSRVRYRSDTQHFFSRDADDCVNLNRPPSSTESILNNNLVENDHLRAVSTSTMPAMYESVASVPRRSRSLDNVESEEHDLSVSDELTGPPRTNNVCARSYDSDAFSRRIKDSVPSKRISSTGIGASKIENSSFGDNVGPNAKSIDAVSRFRDKLKYPGSPRVKFLELLNERRRIVESTRGMSAS